MKRLLYIPVICTLAAFALFSGNLRGQNIYKSIFKPNDTTATHEQAEGHGGWIYLPILFYTPDTRLGFGGLVGHYFTLAKSPEDTTTRLSYVKLFSDYTLNRQLDVWLSYNVYFQEEKYMIRGETRYQIYHDKYYGIGNTAPVHQEEQYAYNYLAFKAQGYKRIYPRMFVGLGYEASSYWKMHGETPFGEIHQDLVHGSDGGINSGVGLLYSWDKRENLFNSRTGMYLDISSYFFDPVLGSDFKYQNLQITYSKYFPIRKKAAFGLNFFGNFNHGRAPFYRLAPVGGDKILRGYAKNRFRDQNFVGGQAEIRFPIWWRFGGVTFVGAGDVFKDTGDLALQHLKYSYGLGLRFMLDTKERVNIRMDYGFGRKSRGFYFSIGEAF